MPLTTRIDTGRRLGEGYYYVRGMTIGPTYYHTVSDDKRTERLIVLSPVPDEKNSFIVMTDHSPPAVIDNLTGLLGLVKAREEGKHMYVYKTGKKGKK